MLDSSPQVMNTANLAGHPDNNSMPGGFRPSTSLALSLAAAVGLSFLPVDKANGQIVMVDRLDPLPSPSLSNGGPSSAGPSSGVGAFFNVPGDSRTQTWIPDSLTFRALVAVGDPKQALYTVSLWSDPKFSGPGAASPIYGSGAPFELKISGADPRVSFETKGVQTGNLLGVVPSDVVDITFRLGGLKLGGVLTPGLNFATFLASDPAEAGYGFVSGVQESSKTGGTGADFAYNSAFGWRSIAADPYINDGGQLGIKVSGEEFANVPEPLTALPVAIGLLATGRIRQTRR